MTTVLLLPRSPGRSTPVEKSTGMLSDIENIVQLFEREPAIDDMADLLHQVHAVDAAMETLAIEKVIMRTLSAQLCGHDSPAGT